MSDNGMKREKKKAEKAKKTEKAKKAKMSRKKDEKEAQKMRKEEEEKSAKKDRSIEEKILKEVDEMEKKDREEEEKQQRQKEEDEKERRKREESEWLKKVDASCAKLKEENPTSIASEEVLKRDGYEIQRVDVAAGKTAKFYKAKDKNGTELLAKLIILRSLKQKVVEKLKESLKIVKYLKNNNHPNVIKIYDVFSTSDKVYIFTEKMDGAFKTVIKGTPNDEVNVRKWAQNIADAILFLHANGIAHQNILAENILVDSQGTLKLSGFSYASIAYDSVNKSFFKGSPASEYFPHFSPERIKDKYDPIKADMFSFGVLIIYFMTRTYPFRLAGSEKSKYPLNVQWKLCLALKKVQLSPELKELLTLLFDPNPEKRPHMREVIKKPWITGEFTPSPAPAATTPPASGSPSQSDSPAPPPDSPPAPAPAESPAPAPAESPAPSTPPDSQPPSPSPDAGAGNASDAKANGGSGAKANGGSGEPSGGEA